MMRLTLLVSLCLLYSLPPLAWAADDARRPDLVRIEQVEVHGSAVGPVVLLKARNKAIPVFVDPVVAQSIQAALLGQKLARPLTHDLMRSVLEKNDGKVTQAVITLKQTTFYADLTIATGGRAQVFDSRSSDAIALCILFKAPIFVSQQLLDSSGRGLDEPEKITL
jgi:bifunctional DNase/RNase